jgi:alkylation response protein AidB-like acyl-CoA dehydrogenase
VFEFTLEYAKDRVAFGRSIGSYQAIKHRLADLLTTLESCKAASTGAAEALEGDTDRAGELASVAKAFIGRSASSLVQECVQIHGGIGVTWEHDIHLYLRRVATNTALFGSPAAHEQHLFALLEP